MFMRKVFGGGTLVTARVEEQLVTQAEENPRAIRSVDLSARRSDFEGDGWSRFDPQPPSYAADEARHVP